MVCHSDDHTVCVLQHGWFISHPVLCLCMWQRRFPVACAPVPISGCNWSRRFSLTRIINLCRTRCYPEVGGNLLLRGTGSCARDCTERRRVHSVSIICYISQTICNRTSVCNPYRSVHTLHPRLCNFSF